MPIRKNQRNLTRNEKRRFVAALKELKSSGVYDRYVKTHWQAMMGLPMMGKPDPAHGGPAFLAWHREYLKRFEEELQRVDPSVTIPYWNWVQDQSKDGPPWTDDFLGGDGRRKDRQVTTGPFAYSTGEWPINVTDEEEDPDFLTRGMGLFIPTLPTAKRVGRILRIVPYDDKPWNFRSNPRHSFRAALENGPHNKVHMWVGGNMTAATSPNDPAFWLHHCNVDRLWAKWQRRHPKRTYLPKKGAARGHNRNDPMWPWRSENSPPTPATVLNHRELGYRYDDEANW